MHRFPLIDRKHYNLFVRYRIQKSIFIFLLFFVIKTQSIAQDKTNQPIDVVFCLDLSNSSNGLIDQFRNHLWDYWNFFKHCQPQPDFRIGVVTYARFSYGKANGYSKVQKDLGTDFEMLSNILYKIPSKIEKGDQYVGAALNTCLKKISWSKDPNATKIIFLVGNGDVYTGRVDVDEVLNKLTEKNINVHTTYCIAPGERKAIVGWQKIAQKGGGKISTISLRRHNFDRLNGFDLQRFRLLNRKFNNTYLYYGKGGKLRRRILQVEDNHIYVTNTEGFRYRSLYKISDDYQNKNYSWDLVDLYHKDPLAYLDIDRKLLNDSCKKMTDEQIKEYIIYKKYERKKLASMISEMLLAKEKKDKEVESNINRKMNTFDRISIQTIKDILKENGCEFLTN